MTIRQRFLYSILSLIIIPMLVMPWVGYWYVRGVISDQMIALTNQNLQQMASGINHIVDDVISSSNAIVLDEEILDVLQQKKTFEYEFMADRFIEKKLKNVEAGKLYPYNTEIILIDFYENIYTTGESDYWKYDQVVKQDWFERAIENKGYFLWLAPEKQYLEHPDSKQGFIMVRLVQRDYIEESGVLIIRVYPERKIDDILYVDDKFKGTMQYLVNNKGEIILQTDDISNDYYYPELFHDIKVNSVDNIMEINNTKVIVSSKKINKTNWSIIQIAPYNLIMKEIKGYRNFTIIFNSIFILLIILSAYILSGHITKSIRQLCCSMEQVMRGNFQVKSQISGSEEINLLNTTFNIMIDKIQQLIEKVRHVTQERQRTKLEALQAQINPHFLLNTLNGIKWLCVIEGAQVAERMLMNLGFLLENTLGRYDDTISLRDEIEGLEKYAELQKMRYGNIFHLSSDIPEDLYDVQIPVLLLQPIVENSILHAFEDYEEIGQINVKAQQCKQYIHISISDNGVGLSEKDIEQIFELEERKEPGKYSSIGLKNVKERIKLYYGEDSDMTIECGDQGGTVVTLKIKKYSGL